MSTGAGIMIERKRYRIVAWGSKEHPPLETESDFYPVGLSQKYPNVHVMLLHSVDIESDDPDDGQGC